MNNEMYEARKPQKKGAPKKDVIKKGHYFKLSSLEYQSVTYLLDTMRQNEKLKKKNLQIKKSDLLSDDKALCYCYKQFYAVSNYELSRLEENEEKPIKAFGVIKETFKSFYLSRYSAYNPDFKDKVEYYEEDKKPFAVIDKKTFKSSSQIDGYSPILYPNYKRALAALLLFYKSNVISKLKTSANTEIINNFLNLVSDYPLCKALEYTARCLEMDYLFNTDELFVEEELRFEDTYLAKYGYDEYRKLLASQETLLI